MVEAASSLDATDKQLYAYKMRDTQQRILIHGLTNEARTFAIASQATNTAP